MLRNVILGLIACMIFYGCNPSGSRSEAFDFVPDPDNPSTFTETGDVIYALRIPTDIVSFFEKTGTGFDPTVTCPLEKIPLYDNPEHMALLLGVLGVDLSYCNLFDRRGKADEYYFHIELLANRLELPQDIFKEIPGEDRSTLENSDSLRNQIHRIYTRMDGYFRENNQLSLASLSLLGGWLEAMYIGVRIYRDKDVLEMGDRILQQKYSLNSLSGILSNHQESLMVRRYVHSVNKLKEVYDKIDIRYEPNSFEMDSSQHLFRANLAEIVYEPAQLDEICGLIQQLREDMLPAVHNY